MYLWVRDLMTVATTEALYGPANPFRNDASLMKDTWDFEADLSTLMLNLAPSLTARKCYLARGRLQAALGAYYGADGDAHPAAAQIVKNRANVLRKFGIPGSEVGVFEVALLHVATTNTIPTLFWMVAHVFSSRGDDGELVRRLREQLESVVMRTKGEEEGDEVTLDISALEEKCPLLVRCYRETTRLVMKGTGNRRVMEDTTISDAEGRTYLLKKGCNVMLSADVSHSLATAWGAGCGDTFDPDRFIVKSGKENAEAEKLKRAAYIPFGGGKHLCPGRNFAYAEILGFVASLVMGFDVVMLDKEMKQTTSVPPAAPCVITSTAVKPVGDGEGFGIRIRRREGWEKVTWRYIS